MKLIAADVGGTKTLLALAEGGEAGQRVLEQRRFDSAAFATFEAMLDEFLGGLGAGRGAAIDGGCFAVAGPISADGQSAKVTNLSWGIDVGRVLRDFPIRAVRLVNDFEAQAYGIGGLADDELTWLQAGRPRPRGPRLVVGAGTGLGVCQLVWCEGRYGALPSEGGHADFAPNGALQGELLAWLHELYGGHVAVERVISGPGLVSIYRFLSTRFPARASAALQDVDEADAPAAVSAAALGTPPDPLARETLDLFVSIYGAHAGSLALTTLPWGGVYIAGGIAPRILPAMTDGGFMKAFNDKGRMSRLTADMAVALVMNQETGLAGALQVARQLCR
jgi:glucokinase